MSKKPIVIKTEQRPEALNVVGEKITIFADKDQTSGHEIFFQDGPEGAGPPPHEHSWDETFFVLDGNIEIGFDDEIVHGEKGTFVYVPANTKHWFRFGKGGARMISITGQNTDAANFFKTLSEKMEAPNAGIETLIDVGSQYSVRL